MKGALLLSLLLLGLDCFAAIEENNSVYAWTCDSIKEKCTKTYNPDTNATVSYPSVELCRLICGKFGALWPRPTIATQLSTQLFEFPVNAISFILPADDALNSYLKDVSLIFFETLSIEDTSTCQKTNSLSVYLNVASADLTLNWNTLEDYTLTVSTNGNQSIVTINSTTAFGARHALETLSQLIEVYPSQNQAKCLAIIDTVKIIDSPTYAHRGLMLDTARNFYSVESIKRQIDAMGYSKLNVLHWHVTDSQSFPLEIPNLPNMTKYGSYSEERVYHSDDVRGLVQYAKLRGVRIIIEIDAPSHAGNGWQWGPDAGLGNLAVCINQAPYKSYCIEPPCGQLNPINSNVYKTLQTLYGDILDMLSAGEVFHMGGDEVFIPCWNSTQEIINYISDKPRTKDTFLDLWGEFQTKALDAYDKVVGNHNSSIIMWTSDLTDVAVIQKYLPKERYVIHTWVPADDPAPKDLLALGYRVIVSTKDAWYLDHGFWGTTQYHNWRTVYDNLIPSGSNTLGGEVCMWGEYVDDHSAEPRIWPRASAAAERLWSDPFSTSVQAETRFYRQRERLVARGVKAEAIVPRWCYQNEGGC